MKRKNRGRLTVASPILSSSALTCCLSMTRVIHEIVSLGYDPGFNLKEAIVDIQDQAEKPHAAVSWCWYSVTIT